MMQQIPAELRRIYFDRAARFYDIRSSRGLWAKVRETEGRALDRFLGSIFGAQVLELGCGTGHYAERMRSRGAVVLGVDSSSAMIRELQRKGFDGLHAEIAGLRLGNRFPVILAAGLVEFLEREEELFSVAKIHALPEARLVILAPRAGLPGIFYRLGHNFMGCPARVRTVKQLERVAYTHGWILERVQGAGPLAKALLFRRGPVNESIVSP